jgi:hypothetical protein
MAWEIFAFLRSPANLEVLLVNLHGIRFGFKSDFMSVLLLSFLVA